MSNVFVYGMHKMLCGEYILDKYNINTIAYNEKLQKKKKKKYRTNVRISPTTQQQPLSINLKSAHNLPT